MAAIWGDEPPAEIDSALNAILSKLRRALKDVGLGPPETGIHAQHGSITLRLPAETWIDLEAAANAMNEADGAWRRGDRAAAWALANVAVSVGKRPLLPDLDAPWIETRRSAHRAMLVRGLERLAEVSRANGEPDLAAQYTGEVLDLEPPRAGVSAADAAARRGG